MTFPLVAANDDQHTKSRVADLAAFGGTPAFEAPLHVGRPNIGNRQHFFALLNQAFDRKWLTNDGPLVQEFERQIATLAGVEQCVGTCNATVALEMVARAAGLTGEIIMPAFTFVASAHAFAWLNIDPVFCDIDPDTLTIDAEAVSALITPRTSAILGVHVFGRPCAVTRLETIARKSGLFLAFDAAHALACTAGGLPIGGFGDVEVFSFHATKFVNAFEGGALTTRSQELANQLRRARNFGFDGYDHVTGLGINGKMTEASAAMGLTSLDSIDTIVRVNKANHTAYAEQLVDVPGVRVLGHSAGEMHNYQYVVALIDEAAAGLSRDEIVELLHAENVLARRYFHPGCHRMEPYASARGEQPPLPVTEQLSRTVMSLPTGTAVSVTDVERVTELIRSIVALGPAIRARATPGSTPASES